MITNYQIQGMTCGNCVAKVTNALEEVPQVLSAKVDLTKQAAEIESNTQLDLFDLQAAIGSYKITESNTTESTTDPTTELPTISLETYKPLILIITFILGVSILAQWPLDDFDALLMMRHFMAGFFIVFAFFKLLNLRGFADSYAMYDIIAGRWKAWGFIYPFIELLLGVLYLINAFPFWTNIVVIFVLGISGIGVVKTVLNKEKIKCACLGDVFNLPMSTVTIIEDFGMVLMAAIMLFVH